MSQFCTNCGHPIKEGARFCTHCGFPQNENVDEQATALAEQPEEKPLPIAAPNEAIRANQAHRSRRNKWIYIPILVVVILAIALYYTGKSLSDPERTIQTFKNAVRQQKVHQLTTLIHTNEDIKVTNTQVRAMLSLFKNHPQVYSQILDSMEQTAKNSNAKSVGRAHSLYYLGISGKKYFIFNNYQITANVFHPKVETNLKDMKVGITGVGQTKTASRATGNSPQTIMLNGVVPGYYSFFGQAKNMSLSKHRAILTSNDKITFTGIYIPVNSNIPEAELYVNGKDTGKTFSQLSEYGPFKKGDTPTFSAVYTVNGKSIKTDTLSTAKESSNSEDTTLDQAESNGVELDFDQATDADDFFVLDEKNPDSSDNEDTLKSYLSSYFDALSSAVSDEDTDDFASYFQTGSDLYNSNMKAVKKFYKDSVTEENQSFDINAITYSGDDTFTINVNESWSETVPSDDSDDSDDYEGAEKDFNLKNTYQIKEVAPGELKIVGEKLISKSYQ